MSRIARRICVSAGSAVAVLSSVAALVVSTPNSAIAAETKPVYTLEIRDSKLGSILTDDKGMTLYMFTPDAPNVSNCEGACLNVWPPMMLKAGESLGDIALDKNLRRSKLGIAMRFDGSRQVTYNGYPLYWWVRDRVAGDVTGQWVGNVWFVLNAAGVPNSLRP